MPSVEGVWRVCGDWATGLEHHDTQSVDIRGGGVRGVNAAKHRTVSQPGKMLRGCLQYGSLYPFVPAMLPSLATSRHLRSAASLPHHEGGPVAAYLVIDRPKSAILASALSRSSELNNTFAPLRSRWRMLFGNNECKNAIPLATSASQRSRSVHDKAL